MSDPQQRFMTSHERLADDVGLRLLKVANDFGEGDQIAGNLYALRDAVMAEVLPVLEQLEAAVERQVRERIVAELAAERQKVADNEGATLQADYVIGGVCRGLSDAIEIVQGKR